ncbi:MAG: substrate-binding domain-containing protein [Gammaproteobacteria bacterium]|nr:substrate-binding domain-containing protein [Gammaproteobacteria bacterium]MBU1416293.1 substrate-binding domain-containing protein [Gammaproteobacteria bacterium]
MHDVTILRGCHLRRILLTTALFGAVLLADAAWAQSKALPADAEKIVQAATRRVSTWDGPTTGPAGAKGKSIALIAEDLHNGGILGVAQGVREAARVIGWKVKVFDAGGSAAGRDRAAADALAAGPDGLVVVGADAREMHARLQPFARRRIPIVGWHVGSEAGPVPDSPVAMNVSTDPIEVARITAMAAVVASGGRAGVVIFTDSNFEIAMVKAKAMAYVVRACPRCTLLEVRDVAISRSAESMPGVTRDLMARYGERWTHALAINDIYFDYAVPELVEAGLANDRLSLLSAGDGSAAAFLRIRARTFQTGTVAEPLNLHGWQLVDELNRLLAHQPVSGFIIPVHLVTGDNVSFDGGTRLQFDPDNNYREAYRRIWQR